VSESKRASSNHGLARVFSDHGANRGGAYLGILLAFLGHGALALLVPKPAEAQVAPPPMKQSIELEPPAPEPVKEETPPEPERPREPPPKTAAAANVAPAQVAPPPPAQEAAVLTQRNDEPADFSNSIVVGNAETFAGGQSASNGTSTRAASGNRTGTGTGGVGTAPSAIAAPSAIVGKGKGRARRARLAGGASWDCAFPAEADVAQVDHAVVTLRIAVAQTGATQSVSIEADPGNGFGREARTCAMRKQFDPALDAEGNPVDGSSLINVRFDR
jgi:periplasmic protein TonB